MKVQTSQLLGLAAFMIGGVLAQADADTCPAGYSPVISYITVTASATPEVTPTNGVCPTGYSPVVSYITVTSSVSVTEATSTSAAATTSTTPTTTAVASTSESSTSEAPTTTVYTSLTSTSTVTVGSSSAAAAASADSSSSDSAVNAVESSTSTTAEAATSTAAAANTEAATTEASTEATTEASSTTASATSSASTSSASSTSLGGELSGQATYYGGNVAGGACSFSTYTLPSGIYGTALSDSNWDDSAECGACVSVSYGGKSITAMIVDECPGCGTNHLDLFPTAFSALADSSLGVIDVTWEYVSCPITSAIELVNKSGVSAYWFSMQVVNANEPVESLEVSTDGGSTWTSTTRQTYNFFEISAGTGTTTVDVKITSSSGSVVTVDNVEISSGASTTASSNF